MMYKMRHFLAALLAVAMVVTCLPLSTVVRADSQKIYYIFMDAEDDENVEISDEEEAPAGMVRVGVFVDGGTFDAADGDMVLIANNATINAPKRDLESEPDLRFALTGVSSIVTPNATISANGYYDFEGDVNIWNIEELFERDGMFYDYEITDDFNLAFSVDAKTVTIDEGATMTLKAGERQYGEDEFKLTGNTLHAEHLIVNGELHIDGISDEQVGYNSVEIVEHGSFVVSEGGSITGEEGAIVDCQQEVTTEGFVTYKYESDELVEVDPADFSRAMFYESEGKWIYNNNYNVPGYYSLAYDQYYDWDRDEYNAFVEVNGSIVRNEEYREYSVGEPLTFTLMPPEERYGATPVVEVWIGRTTVGIDVEPGEDNTFTFTYTPDVATGLTFDISWSEYDSITYTPSVEFVVEIGVGGSLSYEISAEGTRTYEEPNNPTHKKIVFPNEALEDDGITITVTPDEGHYIDHIWSHYKDHSAEDITEENGYSWDEDKLIFVLDTDTKYYDYMDFWFDADDGGPGDPDGFFAGDNNFSSIFTQYWDEEGDLTSFVWVNGDSIEPGETYDFDENEDQVFTFTAPAEAIGENGPTVMLETRTKKWHSEFGDIEVTPVEGQENTYTFTYEPDSSENYWVEIYWNDFEAVRPWDGDILVDISHDPARGTIEVENRASTVMNDPMHIGRTKYKYNPDNIPADGIVVNITPKEGCEISSIWFSDTRYQGTYYPDDVDVSDMYNCFNFSDIDRFDVKDGTVTLTIDTDGVEDPWISIRVEYDGDIGPGPDDIFPADGNYKIDYPERWDIDMIPLDYVEVNGDIVDAGSVYDFEANEPLEFTLHAPENRQSCDPIVRIFYPNDEFVYSTQDNEIADASFKINVVNGQFTFTPTSDRAFRVEIAWSKYDDTVAGENELLVMTRVNGDAESGTIDVSDALRFEVDPSDANETRSIIPYEVFDNGGKVTVTFNIAEGYDLGAIWVTPPDGLPVTYVMSYEGGDYDAELIPESRHFVCNDGVWSYIIDKAPGSGQINEYSFMVNYGKPEEILPGEITINPGDIATVSYALVTGDQTSQYSALPEDGRIMLDPDNEPDQVLIKFVPTTDKGLNPIRISHTIQGAVLNPEVRRLGDDGILRLEKGDFLWGQYMIDFADEGGVSNNEYRIEVVGSPDYHPLVSPEENMVYTYDEGDVIVIDLGDATASKVVAYPNFEREVTLEKGNDGKYTYEPTTTAGFFIRVYENDDAYDFDTTYAGENENEFEYERFYDGYPEGVVPESNVGYDPAPNRTATTADGTRTRVIIDKDLDTYTLTINKGDEAFDYTAKHNNVDVTAEVENNGDRFILNRDMIESGDLGFTVTFHYRRTFTITDLSGEGGTVTVPESAQEGRTVTVTAVPDEGYELSGIAVKTAGGESIAVTDNTFVMPSENVNVTATFTKISYTVTLADTTNGEISAVASARMGDTVVVTATPAEGYKLESVIVKDAADNDVAVMNSQFTMPASDVTVSATFAKADYSVTLSPVQNGTAVLSKTAANIGDEITVTTTPDAGYVLDTIKVNGTAITGNKFTMGAANATVAVTFKKAVYTVTVSETTNGTATVSKASANYGDEITVTATPDAGFELDTIKVNGTAISGNKFTMGTENAVVSVTFKKVDYTVTVSAATNGTVTASKTTANAGDVITVTATPDNGYELDAIKVDGTAISGNTFTMPAKNVTVSATFKKLNYTVTVGNVSNGTVTVSKAAANLGDTITVTATPAAGYELDTIKVDGTAISGNTFEMPAKNVTVTATFKKAVYTVTVGDVSNGTVTVSAANASMGDVITVTATPDADYVLDTIKVDGTAISGNTFTMPAKNVVVTAVFKSTLFSMSLEYNSSMVTVASVQATTNAREGDVYTFTVTPKAGYKVTSVKANGTAVAASGGQYTVTQPAGDLKIVIAAASISGGSNGWIKDGSDYYYYKNGKMVTGWLQVGSPWYYMDPETG
ncbi:hypothetical protein SAMN02910456_02729, partial [Ruminococcaceae bacterium YRB3002]